MTTRRLPPIVQPGGAPLVEQAADPLPEQVEDGTAASTATAVGRLSRENNPALVAT